MREVAVVRVHVDERDRCALQRLGDATRDRRLARSRAAGDPDDERLHRPLELGGCCPGIGRLRSESGHDRVSRAGLRSSRVSRRSRWSRRSRGYDRTSITSTTSPTSITFIHALTSTCPRSHRLRLGARARSRGRPLSSSSRRPPTCTAGCAAGTTTRTPRIRPAGSRARRRSSIRCARRIRAASFSSTPAICSRAIRSRIRRRAFRATQ